MRVISTFFQPSTVLHSVKCKLDNSDTEYLIVSKPSKLEVFSLLPEGAKLQCTLEIWGVVSSLKVVHNTPDTLLVTTETPDPLVMLLEYVPEEEGEEPSLREYSHLSLHSPFSRTMEDFEGALVHPSGDVAVVGTYVGKLKALVLKGSQKKTIKSDFDCILTELNVLSICFLPVPVSVHTYVLAILHRDYTGTLQLLAHELSLDGQDLSIDPSSVLPQVTISEEDARVLVPIPATSSSLAGILVLGGQNILFFETGERGSLDKGKGKERVAKGKGRRKSSSSTSVLTTNVEPRAQVDWPLSDLTAYALIDADGSRILLGDKYGQLSILSLARTSLETTLTLVRLGETSPATTITYLNSGIIFVGSHFGDSQIVRITPSADPMLGVQLDILDTHKNLAPIMDAILVDTENSGQLQIITCSGAHNTGSLKIVRNGADLQELAIVDDMVHAKLMWSLRSSYEASIDNILVVSTLQSTHFYAVANTELGTIEELDEDSYAGFSHEATLAIGNMASVILPSDPQVGRTRYEESQHVVQVTTKGVFLVNLFTGMRDSEWNGDAEIVAASLNASQVAVALKGRRLVILMVKDARLVELRSRVFDCGEISTITIHPYDPILAFSNYVAVGFYESNAVSVVYTSDLRRPLLPLISLPHLPVSILLSQFGLDGAGRRRPMGYSKNHPTHLLVGLGDGNLHTYGLDAVDGGVTLGEQKLIPLGSTKPVFIMPFRSRSGEAGIDGHSVLACGSRPVVMYWENGRLKHSPLVRKGISAACPLNSKEFPSSIVFAATTERDGRMDLTSLLIGRVRDLQKLHIRTIPFGLDNPVRIAHYPTLKVLGVGCQRTQPHRVGESPLESCSFKIIDDTTFDQLHHFPCDPDEEVTIVQALTLSLGDDLEPRKTYLVVGTQYIQAGEMEASEGRLLLFEARGHWLPEPKEAGQNVKADRGKVIMATSLKVKGCVFALAELDGQLAAAINESVYIFRLKSMEPTTLPLTSSGVKLEQITKWTHNYIVSNIVSRGDRIYIGDTISSLSVVQWDEAGQCLQNVARDYASLWPVSIETLDEDNIIGCNNDGNLFVFGVNATEKRLEQAGNYYLGDCVNKFIRGALTSQRVPDESVQAEQMFVTSTGRVGVVSEFGKELSLHMTALQRNLGNVILGPGSVKHPKWRAPKNSRGGSDSIGEASGFLDGDFLERFLDYESGSLGAQKVMAGRNQAENMAIPSSQVVQVLEQLQSVH